MENLNAENIIEILDKMDFFQGQRAGRELWNDKPFEVQEQDIANFSRDVNLLKNYIKELTRKLEIANLEIECKERICESYALQYGTVADKEVWLNKERADTVRKVQEELDRRIHTKLAYHGWYLKETVIPSAIKYVLWGVKDGTVT